MRKQLQAEHGKADLEKTIEQLEHKKTKLENKVSELKAKIEAIPVLVNCSMSEADLKAKAETVANNIAALNSAKTAVETVAKSTKGGFSRAAATDCAGFTALVDARKFSK